MEEVKQKRINVGTVVIPRTYNVDYFDKKMTANHIIHSSKNAHCIWFNGQEKLCSGECALENLIGIL